MSLINVQWRQGIELPEAGLRLDPQRGAARAFISHAHSDHVAAGHGLTICSETTHRILKKRCPPKAGAQVMALPLHEAVEWEGWMLKLLPAGHIVGSAMLHLTRKSDGATLLYTGDYKLRSGLSCERCVLAPAEVLIMETTFGRPQFTFPPSAETIRRVLEFVRDTIESGAIPVLLGYSLGKAQEILCALADSEYPVMVHPAVREMTEAAGPLPGRLPAYRLFDPDEAAGHVLVLPPGNARTLALLRPRPCRTAMLTGWALVPGASFRYQADRLFPLSDHADYPELLETVATVAPRRVWLVHGYTGEFAADLRARGYEAWSLEQADQLELGLSADQPDEATVPAAPAPEAAAHSFGAWAAASARIAASSSWQEKIAILSAYFRAVDDAGLPLAARWFAGQTGDPEAGEPAAPVGWAVLGRILQDLCGLSAVGFRSLSRMQSDRGHTAFLALSRMAPRPQPSPQPWLLSEAGAFLRQWRTASAGAQSTLLKDRLRALSAADGSWLVRLLSGAGMAAAESGLVEAALASVFGQSSEIVRDAGRRCGDIGRAAVLTKSGRPDRAQPRPLVPLPFMPAAPVESAAAAWPRAAAGSGRVLVQDNPDGIRAQFHRTPARAEFYDHHLRPLTRQFPELITHPAAPAGEVIMDGKIIAVSAGRTLSPAELRQLRNRSDQADLFLLTESLSAI